MSTRNQVDAESIKSPKKKRSLKRTAHVETASSLAIDMDKSEMDAIFAQLHLGQCEHPQAVLGQVYALAIEAVAKSLTQSLVALCGASSSLSHASDTPFAPLLQKILPKWGGDGGAIQERIVSSIESSKQKIVESIMRATAVGGSLDRQTVRMADPDALRFALPIWNIKKIRPLSAARLEALSHEILRADNATRHSRGRGKTYCHSHTPTSYRFSFDSGVVKPSAGTSGGELTEVIERLGRHVTEAALDVYGHSDDVDWSESGSLLSRDPSIEASPELSAFVRELEEPEVLSETESSGTTPSEGETGVPDNDELARAFEILLHEFDDEC